MKTVQPTILIIIGVTGDLARRKLLPSIAQMAAANVLPDNFRIIGVTRRPNIKISDLLSKVNNPAYLNDHIELLAMDITGATDYDLLGRRLKEIEKKFGSAAQRLFYLSVPPQVSSPIIELLGVSGLSKIPDTKLLLEKPFGVDLPSAIELVQHIDQYFFTEQIYRIDHFLAKDMAQNLIVFRGENSLFRRTWNKDFIAAIEIIASETIGIEGRSVFYEQTGALRDLVQSHLLQLAALTLMDIPADSQTKEIPERRRRALSQLNIAADRPLPDSVKRGQYRGYQNEVNNNGSTVETFISLTLESSDSRWAGVPITLTTGKNLDKKFTGIRILYKKERDDESNELTLRLQPDDGVELCLWAKKPGYEHEVIRHPLKFAFQDHYNNLPDAYEQVLFSAMNSDHSLFTSSAEVLESWRILDPIQKAWGMSNDDLLFYEPGNSIQKILSAPTDK